MTVSRSFFLPFYFFSPLCLFLSVYSDEKRFTESTTAAPLNPDLPELSFVLRAGKVTFAFPNSLDSRFYAIESTSFTHRNPIKHFLSLEKEIPEN